jgi:hypothetical protein
MAATRSKAAHVFKVDDHQDMTKNFESLKGLYPLSGFSLLRPESENSVAGNVAKNIGYKLNMKLQFKQELVEKSMVEFQTEIIEHPLFKLSTAYCGGKQKSKALKNEAREIFKSILGYMKDRFHAYPITLAHEVVFRGLEEPLLRDEIYCQLVKQTTKNPSMESLCLGWKLIFLCLSTFPPASEELEKILLSHIAGVANSKIQKYMPFDTVDNIASNCFVALQKIIANGPRKDPPSLEEIRVLTEAKASKLRVFMSSGDFLDVPVSSMNRDMNIRALCGLITMRIGKPPSIDAELRIVVEKTDKRMREELATSPDDLVLSLISHWEGEARNNPNLKFRFELVLSDELKSE